MDKTKPIIMLWSDTSERPLTTKVSEAASYYAKKYGKEPNMLRIHPARVDEYLNAEPSVSSDDGVSILGIPVTALKSMLLCDIHIGYVDKGDNGNAK